MTLQLGPRRTSLEASVGRSATIAGGACLLVAGGAALFWAVQQAADGTNLESLQKVVAIIDGEVKQRRAEVKTRADSTAIQTPLLKAIGTDSATVEDQDANGDFRVMTPAPGETLELGQVLDKRYTRLLLKPSDGVPTKHAGQAGEHLQLGEVALLSQGIEFAPGDREKRSEGYLGYLVVSRPLDLATATAELVRLGVPATLGHSDTSMVLGSAPAATAKITSLPIPSIQGLVLRVAPVAPVAIPVAPMAAGGGAALAGLVLLVLGLTRRTLPARLVGVDPAGMAATSPSRSQMAAGTPSVHGGAVTMLSGPAAGSTAGLTAGAVLGRWELIRLLGSGGMADVHLARSRGEAGFEKLVALKVMHGFLARNERAVAHFLDEARVAAQIVHPNVVQILDLGKIGDDYVIIMEYVDGANLDSLLSAARAAGRQVPLPVALGILRRICDGLTAAHRAIAKDGTPLSIVHRDVKSGNILVSRQGVIKVVDFGIAKAAQQSHITMAGETKGTPSMMAPEQRVGDVVDQRADVYSTAAVGYELLTGTSVNLDLASLAHLGIEGWPHLPRPSEVRPQLPTELDAILLGAMAFDRERRPIDCAAFEALFEEVAKNYQIECSDKDIARWAESELAKLQLAREVHATDYAAPAQPKSW
jgi:Protein kinase domain